jgi:hypothetical protein
MRIAEEKSFYLNKRFYIYFLKIQMFGYGTVKRSIITTTTSTNITTAPQPFIYFLLQGN